MACRAVPRAPKGLQLAQLHMLRGAGKCAANLACAAAESPQQPPTPGGSRASAADADAADRLAEATMTA
jgi:hypothetical protein